MLSHFDNLLRHLFMTRLVAALGGPPVTEAQVGFQPPDEEWRSKVSQLGNRRALNIYLVELRENRRLRSNERLRTVERGYAREEPAPARLDCHYLISAWSPATEEVGRTTDEHDLLYQASAVLFNALPLVPRAVYAPDPLPGSFPAFLADAEVPLSIGPVEGFPKYAEFWGTMGPNHRWKPALQVIATLPVVLRTEVAGPIVTTRVAEYRQAGRPETAETWVQIGGTVLDAHGATPVPLPAVWVQIETPAGQPLTSTHTDDAGRFTMGSLRPGIYRLRARAAGLGEVVRLVDLPSPSGEYDLRFT